MTTARSFLLFFAASLGHFTTANALVTTHDREPLHCSGWTDQLTAIINDPARVSGRIGPLAPSARFEFEGDVDAFNRVLARYAALDQKERVLDLSADPTAGGDFALSVTQDGTGFLHLHLPGRIALADLKIPAGVSVEAIPGVVLPTDPKQRANIESEEERIKAFVVNRQAQLQSSQPARVPK